MMNEASKYTAPKSEYTLVFDTETTGLIPKRKHIQQLGKMSEKALLAEMPWAVQLACTLYRDVDQWPIAHFSSYILTETPDHGRGEPPRGVAFFEENKLLPEYTRPTAISMHMGLDFFGAMLNRADRLVAHNISYDAKIMYYWYLRERGVIPPAFTSLPMYCTKEALTDIMRLPNKWPGSYKWPTMMEAYKHFIDPEGFSGDHDAMVDTSACAEVYYATRKMGIEYQEVKVPLELFA